MEVIECWFKRKATEAIFTEKSSEIFRIVLIEMDLREAGMEAVVVQDEDVACIFRGMVSCILRKMNGATSAS